MSSTAQQVIAVLDRFRLFTEYIAFDAIPGLLGLLRHGGSNQHEGQHQGAKPATHCPGNGMGGHRVSPMWPHLFLLSARAMVAHLSTVTSLPR